MDVVTKVEGTPAGGYRFVSDIVASNSRQFNPGDSAMDVAIRNGQQPYRWRTGRRKGL